MNCNIVKDLIPLYIDKCCSAETEKLVDEHIAECGSCRRVFNEMSADTAKAAASSPTPVKFERVNEWRASIIQSAALFISFAMIIAGVMFEAATPMGDKNGAWLFALIIPATAFLLGLANLYFVRFYKSRKGFALASCSITFVLALLGLYWGITHYGVMGMIGTVGLSSSLAWGLGAGIALTIVLCAASSLLANVYARSLGKE